MGLRKGPRNILVGFAALVAGGYGAWQGFAELQLRGFVMRDLPVTQSNLIAVDPQSGYRIIVANQMAQLVKRSPENREGPELSDKDLEAQTDESERSRLPVKDLLGTLQGDQESLNRFVMVLNKLDANELPPAPVIWTSEELERAFANAGPERTRLERDLNVRLDGTPLEELRPDALEIGIVVDFPVPIEAKIEGKPVKLTARLQVPYVPQFARDVMGRIQERSTITDDMIRGTYLDEARKILAGDKAKEDVVKSIRSRYTDERVQTYRVQPENVLKSVQIILNDEQMESASVSPAEATNAGPLWDLSIRLNDEGRKRIWKFSRENRGFQVLLTVDGIPVAAPRFRQELMTHDVTIRQLGDERLAEEAAKVISNANKEGKTTQ